MKDGKGRAWCSTRTNGDEQHTGAQEVASMPRDGTPVDITCGLPANMESPVAPAALISAPCTKSHRVSHPISQPTNVLAPATLHGSPLTGAFDATQPQLRGKCLPKYQKQRTITTRENHASDREKDWAATCFREKRFMRTRHASHDKKICRRTSFGPPRRFPQQPTKSRHVSFANREASRSKHRVHLWPFLG